MGLVHGNANEIKDDAFPLYFNRKKFNITPPQIVFQSDYKHLWWNSDWFKAEELTRCSMRKCRTNLYSDKLEFISSAVCQHLYCLKKQFSEDSCITDIINNMPIYLVTKDMKGKQLPLKNYHNDETIKCPADCHPCCDIKMDELKKNIKEKSLNKVELYTYQHILGMYHKRPKIVNGSIEHIYESRRIFLWVDNIKAAAIEENKYKALLFFVLCHEFMHALMDIFSGEKIVIKDASKEEVKVYKNFREESLANGLAIYLCNECEDFDEDDKQFISEFVKSQPLPYKMGQLFTEPNVFQPEVEEWMDIKSGRKQIDKSDIYNWLDDVVKKYEQLEFD